MKIIFYPGFDLDKFIDQNPHLHLSRRASDHAEFVEVATPEEVIACIENHSVAARLAKLENDFYGHSHVNNGFASPCAGDVILKTPAGTWSSCYDKPEERKEAQRLAGEPVGKSDVREPGWIVNDSGELGVMVDGKAFFLYKGHSLVYETGLHDDGRVMRYRAVDKREFGECCHPLAMDGISAEQYFAGLGGYGEWKALPAIEGPT